MKKKMSKFQAPKEELSMPRWGSARMTDKGLKSKMIKSKKLLKKRK